MRLFTVVAEWRAGTYVRQVMAQDEVVAIDCWLRQLEMQPIKEIGPAARRKLVIESQQGALSLVALDGLSNCWCATALVRGSLLLLHLVATE